MFRTAAVILLAVITIAAGTAHAGGLMLPERGVRTLARGGAFVAGADDADALWQNPAGLAHGSGNHKRSLLFDVALLYQTVEHVRLDDAGNPLERVTNQQPGTLVPALAGSLGVGDKLVIAGGLSSPYMAFPRYAVTGPQRYAAGAADGSALVLITAGVGYKVDDRLRIGATIQNLVSKTKLQIVANGCPSTITCGPPGEDPGFDTVLTVDQTDAVSPGGSLGIQYDVIKRGKQAELTLGLALQSPLRIASTGTLAVQLPTVAVFDGATVSGDRVSLATTLPATIRAGIEWRPTRAFRIEAALDVELWSLHQEISIVPEDVIVDTPGGSITMSPMTIPRDYKTSFAPSIGVEWHGSQLMLGAGYAYETSAAPPRTVSVLAIDAAKHLIGIGGGYEDAGWQIGAALGVVAVSGVDVPVADAAVGQLAPFGAMETTNVNAGSYRSHYLVAGLRFARRW